jgi:hypothetical protein
VDEPPGDDRRHREPQVCSIRDRFYVTPFRQERPLHVQGVAGTDVMIF